MLNEVSNEPLNRSLEGCDHHSQQIRLTTDEELDALPVLYRVILRHASETKTCMIDATIELLLLQHVAI